MMGLELARHCRKEENAVLLQVGGSDPFILEPTTKEYGKQVSRRKKACWSDLQQAYQHGSSQCCFVLPVHTTMSCRQPTYKVVCRARTKLVLTHCCRRMIGTMIRMLLHVPTERHAREVEMEAAVKPKPRYRYISNLEPEASTMSCGVHAAHIPNVCSA